MARVGTTSHCLLRELDLDDFLIYRHMVRANLLLMYESRVVPADLDPLLLLLLADADDSTVMMRLLVNLVPLRAIRSEI